MRRPGAGLALLPAGLLAGVGIAIRVHNAIRYPVDWGFDASFNWRYIQRLIRDWSLPAPDTTWATADPPLYFYLCALIARSADAAGDINAAKIAIPLLSTLAGLAVVALAVALVRRSGRPRVHR